MLTATDDPDGDTFRIKIWDRSQDDTTVFNNQPGASDDSYIGTSLAGGSIVVHSE